MATKTKIRWQERVDRPYLNVHDLLTLHSNDVFHQATSTAESRTETMAADLHTKFAGFEFRKDVLIKIRSYTEIDGETEQKMIIDLEWKAAEAQYFFPAMSAQLHVFPMKEDATQLDFRGEYEPPMGFIGKAVDTMLGHTIAERCIHHFVEEVAEYLKRTIPSE